MAAASDAYSMPSYYGSFQNPNSNQTGFSNDEGQGAPWSNNGSEGFSGGYSSGMHDSGHSGHGQYSMEGMFSGGGGGAFGNFGSQPGFGYGFHGTNGDYSWNQNQGRKSHYDDYYNRYFCATFMFQFIIIPSITVHIIIVVNLMT